MNSRLNQIILLLTFCGTFHFGFSQDSCLALTTCDTCVATTTQSCGWCAPTQQCLNGSVNGPSNGTCLGPSWEFQTCTPCNSFKDCRDCNIYSKDCFWCQTTNNGAGSCEVIGNHVGCPYTQYWNCPCNVYSDCGECTSDNICSWCETTGTCFNTNDPKPCSASQLFTHSHPCDCTTIHGCPNCMYGSGGQSGDCLWCANGVCNVSCGMAPIAHSCSAFCGQNGGDCTACSALEGCAWCESTQMCVDSQFTNCSMLTHTCQFCDDLTDCWGCNARPGCGWCENSGNCQTASNTSCMLTHTCGSSTSGIDSCTLEVDCNSCQRAGCAWCEDRQGCLNPQTAVCFIAHTCPPKPELPGRKFDGPSFVGGMFLIIGIIAVGLVGFFVYRWRTGAGPLFHRSHYTELR